MEHSDEQFSDDEAGAGANLNDQEHQDSASVSQRQQSLHAVRDKVNALGQDIHKMQLRVLGVDDEEANLEEPLGDPPIHGIELSFEQTEEMIAHLDSQAQLLKDIMFDSDMTIYSFENQILDLTFDNEELLYVLEWSEDENYWASRTIKDLVEQCDKVEQDTQCLINNFQSTKDILMKELSKSDKLEQEIKEQKKEMKNMETKLEACERDTSKINFEICSSKREIDVLKDLIRKLEPRQPECLSAEEKEVFERIAGVSDEIQSNP